MRGWNLVVVALSVTLLAVSASSASATGTIENGDPSIAYHGWTTVLDAGATNGSYRASGIAGDTVKFAFTGTSVAWLTRVGPNEGKAKVTLDGVSQGTVNEYAAAATFEQ